MRRNKLTAANTTLDAEGNLLAATVDSDGKPIWIKDLPAHTVHGEETTEFTLTLKRSARKLDEEETSKPLPTGEKYLRFVEKHGQQKLL